MSTPSYHMIFSRDRRSFGPRKSNVRSAYFNGQLVKNTPNFSLKKCYVKMTLSKKKNSLLTKKEKKNKTNSLREIIRVICAAFFFILNIINTVSTPCDVAIKKIRHK